MRAACGIGTSVAPGVEAEGRARPDEARSASGVVWPLTVISPSMPAPKLKTNSSPCGATIGKSGDGAVSSACSTPGAVPIR